MQKLTEKLWVWGQMDPATLRQAHTTASLPIIAGHVALMPDAHVGMGATIGSVIPTKGAVIPSAVGVDLGCGMIAVWTDVKARDITGSDEYTDADVSAALRPLLPEIERSVPAGVGQGHKLGRKVIPGEKWMAAHPAPTSLSEKQSTAAVTQFGSLGSGNHFVEICLDKDDGVWVILHSGSRGIGNQLAQGHIRQAKADAKAAMTRLPDPDLAYFVEGTPEFSAYVADMLWAQDYALGNREAMMDATLNQFYRFLKRDPRDQWESRINAHHNFCAREQHGDQHLWITRRGAIGAAKGQMGIIPGSMATGTYIVRGLGNPDSFMSCSHGAGRKMSRSQAKRELTVESLAEAMGDKAWLADRAEALLDEHPDSYKDIETVMADQTDLVEVVAELRQVLNYKGV